MRQAWLLLGSLRNVYLCGSSFGAGARMLLLDLARVCPSIRQDVVFE